MANGPGHCIFTPGGKSQVTPQIGDGGASHEECAKLVAAFNKEVALYCTLAVGLGGTNDSEKLREELKSSRLRACDLAHQIKSKLIPLLRSKMQRQEEQGDLERLYRLYSGCLELLETQLLKMASLQRTFPLYSGIRVMINTGICEPVIPYKACLAVEQLDTPTTDKSFMEKEELLRLERAACDIHEVVYTVSQTMDIQPWDIEPEISTENFDCGKSISSNSDAESSVEISPTSSNESSSRRKCTCVALVTISAVILCSSVVGLLVGFLHGAQ
ncbi:regulator of G-protein signaling 9-binding protein-like [Haliotis rufescens]|uniref:regulator of G-protein signaling 9-binding protein-like n=1 Tax=Haliotis rufescens TaxID=6454 RepID=UPI00201E916C|nr:regulator of G-protein signaling 9-binding protein-like [Haliotis rufescens]